MDQSEFDKFAEEYRWILERSIKASGEGVEYFAEYKIQDVANIARMKHYPADMRIMDFGAGVGTSVPYFRKHLPDSLITCLDVSEKSLELGREKFSTQAEFLKFDGENIPISSDYYHIVFAACVFHHINGSEHLRLLTEIKRVLKPGGTLVVFEHNPLNPLTSHVVNSCPFDENAVLIRAGVMQRRISDAQFIKTRKHYRLFFPKFLKYLRPMERYLFSIPLGAQYYVAAEKASG